MAVKTTGHMRLTEVTHDFDEQLLTAAAEGLANQFTVGSQQIGWQRRPVAFEMCKRVSAQLMASKQVLYVMRKVVLRT